MGHYDNIFEQELQENAKRYRAGLERDYHKQYPAELGEYSNEELEFLLFVRRNLSKLIEMRKMLSYFLSDRF